MSASGVSACLGRCLPWEVSATPPVDRQVPVKILPCPKLRNKVLLACRLPNETNTVSHLLQDNFCKIVSTFILEIQLDLCTFYMF